MFSNDHLLPSLAKQRQKELWEEAQRRRLVREFKRHRPGFQGSMTRKASGLKIILGRKLKARQVEPLAIKAR